MKGVYVSNVGIVSSIGMGLAANWATLQQGKTGIVWSEKMGLMLAEIPYRDADLAQWAGVENAALSRNTLLALLAAQEAWGNHKHTDKLRTGLISATSTGGMDKMEQRYMALQGKEPLSATALQYNNGKTTEELAHLLGFRGYVDTISTACSAGANALMMGARLLEANRLDRVLVGGVDVLTLYNIRGFTALGIYAPQPCAPFDDNRNGLNLGEGAAFLVLENEKSLALTGNSARCRLVGWGNTSDAFHPTASSDNGRGAAAAMHKAIKKADIQPSQIGYVNAHGTGTENNDLSECIALQSVFGAPLPPFSSTKSFTGHTLAAAGAIEAVFSILCLQHQCLLPNLNFKTPMHQMGSAPVDAFLSVPSLDFVLSNSFGFSGNCTSLIFSKLCM